MKAKVITTGRVVKIEYAGFDNDGYSIYREIGTGREYHEIELDFDVFVIRNLLVDALRSILCI